MDKWSEGYVSDIGYTYGYFPELNPLRTRLAFLYAGLEPPTPTSACELGYGQGVSVNIHAAASAVQWHGTDFMPAQAHFARELSAVSGAAAQLHDDAFAEYCQRSDLPDFDYIGLHGIWSWVSDDNRRTITEFLRRKLKVGGAAYVSYNAMPGWAVGAPLRKLLSDYDQIMGAPGEGQLGKVSAALTFVDKVMAANPAFAASNPEAAKKLAALKTQNGSYLAHEYFNGHWDPMYFTDMANWLAPAKLSFACSGRYLDHIDMLNLTPQQHAMVSTIPDPTLQQTVRDFVVNRQFRKDYWVKGARRLAPFEQSEALRQQRVVLVAHRPDVSMLVEGPTGEARLNDAIYRPLLDALADHQVQSLGQLEQVLAPKNVGFAHLMQAVMVLCGQGKLEAAQDEATIAQARGRTHKLNQHLIRKARGSADITHLASPVTGGGVAVTRAGQLFLLARAQEGQGGEDPQAWARFALNLLAGPAAAQAKEAKVGADEQAQLTRRAREFADKELPILRALQVV